MIFSELFDEIFEERAAIREYEGKMLRLQAEQLAKQDVQSLSPTSSSSEFCWGDPYMRRDEPNILQYMQQIVKQTCDRLK